MKKIILNLLIISSLSSLDLKSADLQQKDDYKIVATAIHLKFLEIIIEHCNCNANQSEFIANAVAQIKLLPAFVRLFKVFQEPKLTEVATDIVSQYLLIYKKSDRTYVPIIEKNRQQVRDIIRIIARKKGTSDDCIIQ